MIKENSDKNYEEPDNLYVNKTFWNNRYITKETGWDLGEVSPPIKTYIDQLVNKNLKILIPGCGNSYEAEYLLQQNFTNITLIDIAPLLVSRLKEKFISNSNIKIVLGNFFEHNGQYDLIFEQTFFCALHPSLRKNYVTKMKDLLVPGGKLVGLLFNREFELPGPPYGGSKSHYQSLFEKDFSFKTFELCNNSFVKRNATEMFINMIKR